VRLKLDESLGRRAQDIFTAAGHEVSTVWDQGLAGASDHDLYGICCDEGRTLVALDMDFANPFRFDPATSAGIAVLRVPDSPAGSAVLRAATVLADTLGRRDITGHLWVVTTAGVREFGSASQDDDQ
jgi:hypothetical protein